MTDFIPLGISSGQSRQAEAGDILKDTAGNPLGGGKPTVASWGVREHTFSGTLALIDDDDVVQILTGSGSPRVTLPAATTNNPFFVLINAGGDTIEIETQGGQVTELSSGQLIQLFTNGSGDVWGSVGGSLPTRGFQFMHFAGDQQINSNVLRASGLVDDALGSSHNLSTEHVSIGTGTIYGASWTAETASDVDIAVYKNGVLSETYVHGGSVQRGSTATLTTSVIAGDLISVIQADASDLNFCRVFLWLDQAGGAFSIDLAQDGQIDGFFDLGQHPSDTGTVTVYSELRHAYPLPVDCDLVTLGVQSQNTSTSFGIYKDGVLVKTISVVGGGGSDYVSTATHVPFSAGDKLSVRMAVDGGDTRIYLIFSGAPAGLLTPFGGVTNVLGRFSLVYNGFQQNATNTVSDEKNEVVFVDSRTLVAAAAIKENAVSDTAEIFKNGILSEATDVLATGLDTTLSTTVVADDYVSIKTPDTGTAPGNHYITLFWE